MKIKYDTLIIGAGLAGLIAACHLSDNRKKNIAIVTSGYGGTPYVAAFNAILKDSPYGDTVQQYCSDMLTAGYHLGNKQLVTELAGYSAEAVELLESWGVSFSKLENGGYRLRHASGSSCPRSLCRTDMLIGGHITHTLVDALKYRGITFIENTACTSLLTENGHILGAMVNGPEGVYPIYANTILAAWGGVGHLYAESTYPDDIDGRTLAMAYDAGAHLIDLEFVEFEPMVSMEPPEAKGEPCPTAMLGEGAYLLNSKEERFLLKARPQGEAGAPKSLINQAIWEEVRAGRGSPLGGVYVDLRHIDEDTLKAYPWFYWREKNAGLDVKKSLLQVGPMAHSHSGGIEIDTKCMSNIGGLFAAGEAAGGMHGACRMAGNAATQAAVSGLAAAKGILEYTAPSIDSQQIAPYSEDPAVRSKNANRVKDIVTQYINRERNKEGLQYAINQLWHLYNGSLDDTFTAQLALSGVLLANAALERTESRGTHLRTDYPDHDKHLYSIRLYKENGSLKTRHIT